METADTENLNNTNSANGTLMERRPAMDRFLESLRDTGNVRLACLAAGVPRRTAYNWRKKWKTFANEWEEALDDAVDTLEEEAWKRAVKGNSDGLLKFLLKAHRPMRFVPMQRREKLNIDLTQLTEEQLKRIGNGEDPIHVLATPG